MLPETDQTIIALIVRTKEHDDGWRKVNHRLYSFFDSFKTPDLIEFDKEQGRVRLTAEGKIVAKHLI